MKKILKFRSTYVSTSALLPAHLFINRLLHFSTNGSSLNKSKNAMFNCISSNNSLFELKKNNEFQSLEIAFSSL